MGKKLFFCTIGESTLGGPNLPLPDRLIKEDCLSTGHVKRRGGTICRHRNGCAGVADFFEMVAQPVSFIANHKEQGRRQILFIDGLRGMGACPQHAKISSPAGRRCRKRKQKSVDLPSVAYHLVDIANALSNELFVSMPFIPIGL